MEVNCHLSCLAAIKLLMFVYVCVTVRGASLSPGTFAIQLPMQLKMKSPSVPESPRAHVPIKDRHTV